MNTLQPTSRNKKTPRLKSGALMRTDQEQRGHMRVRGITGDERQAKAWTSRYGDFGTIGSKMSRPARF